MNLVVLFLIVVWIALIAWTFLDARRRINDPVLVACATGASLFPYVGTIIYSILRPPEFLEDARERELEIRSSELRVRQLEEQSCPNCGFPIERSYLRCPNCRARVKDPCESLRASRSTRAGSLCPYCETPQRRASEPRRAPEEPRRTPDAERAARRRRTAERAPREAGRRQPAQKARSAERARTRSSAGLGR